MTYCKKFISGISAINFSDTSAITLKNLLIHFAYQELKQEEDSVTKRLMDISAKTGSDTLEGEQIKRYKEKQELIKKQLNDRVQTIEKTYGQIIDFEKEPEILDKPAFIKSLAENFRNISHLALTLLDAPPAIKDLQTPLYLEILIKLEQKDQENQLKTLSLLCLQDLINQALSFYETTDDALLRSQCQHLVQMSFFEIVRRHCDSVEEVAEDVADYEKYQQVLSFLRAKLQKVDIKKSDIIDNLSQYKDSNGTSFEGLLAGVERKLKINKVVNWQNEQNLLVIKERHALLQALRFGQEDRREYAQKIKANLARDLFWARNIRDMELFTKDRLTDDVFTRIVEQNHLSNAPEFKAINLANTFIDPQYLQYRKLWDLLNGIGNLVKEMRGVQSVSFKNLSSDTIKQIKRLISEQLNLYSSIPQVRVNSETISVDFLKVNVTTDFVNQVYNILSGEGGFGRNFDKKLSQTFFTQTIVTKNLTHSQVSGSSIAEIEQKLKAAGVATTFQEGINHLKDSIRNAQLPKISGLSLDTSNELVLRKLLELYSIRQYPQVHLIFQKLEDMQTAFDLIKRGMFVQATKVINIGRSIHDAYKDLAKLNPDDADATMCPIIEKSKLIISSMQERLVKTKELDAAFIEETNLAQTLAAVFRNEYLSMGSTLDLISEELPRMTDQISEMAKDMARIYERTLTGEPVLTTQEQDAYFSVVQQIAKAVAPQNLENLRFKVKHSISGVSDVVIFDEHGHQVKTVFVNLGSVPLPYSLIKPVGRDFVFSYGGTRGIISPFAGFEEAYNSAHKKKGRFFTNSRLLGVGQYGSVKQVESLLSGLNQVIKKGYVPKQESATFTDESRNALRTRAITARDDTLYRIESDVLQNLSQTQGDCVQGTKYWIEKDKERRQGDLFAQTGTPLQYQIYTERAKGETFADTVNKELNLYTKSSFEYHNPLLREGAGALKSLKEKLALSQEIVHEAQRFAQLKFAHNDIKPENFLYKRNPDGSYQVKFIDWATGGFERIYLGDDNKSSALLFEELFGADLHKEEQDENRCSDAYGRYVEKTAEGVICYGINPTLQIVHGARNGTLPYISPDVALGIDRDRQPVQGINVSLNTVLTNHQSSMDDWALTTMIFGICNREAYFTLVKGRVVTDYVVPEILDIDGNDLLGLKIINEDKFKEYFSCTRDIKSEDNSVMYIPSNQREGEPLHLYRRLEQAKKWLNDSDAEIGQELIARIDTILTRVHTAVANGKGLQKEEISFILSQAQKCIDEYENLCTPEFQKILDQNKVVQELLNSYEGQTQLHVDDLSKIVMGGVKAMEIVCTYPTNAEQKTKAISVLQSVIDEGQFNDKFIGAKKPFRHLLIDCITKGQNEILIHLLSKIVSTNQEFITQVQDDGLLHYAAEQGMVDVFSSLITALTNAGASEEKLFALMMAGYGPQKLKTDSPIKWSTSTVHSAIRNNNPTQLAAILSHLPKDSRYDKEMQEALHLCAVLGNTPLFLQILKSFRLTPEQILAIQPSPEDSSPYHLFLNDEHNLEAIPFEELEKKPELSQKFLLELPGGTHDYPLLLAATNGNYVGVKKLLDLAKNVALSEDQWSQLFTQSDENGKNIFNYILEQSQFTMLSELIAAVKIKCDSPARVVVQLLSNPHPVNPLKNFLKQEQSPTQQFKVLNELLDAISPSIGPEEAQKHRIIALLVSQEWLFEKAQNEQNHAPLRQLLQNDKLSTTLKQSLFDYLTAHIPQEAEVAKKFFSELKQEVFPILKAEAEKTSFVLPQEIVIEAARQRGDFDELFSALMDNEEEIKHLKDEVVRSIQILDSQRESSLEQQYQLNAQIVDLQRQKESLTHALERIKQQKENFAQRAEKRNNKTIEITQDLHQLKALILKSSENLDELHENYGLLSKQVNTLEEECAQLREAKELLSNHLTEARLELAAEKRQLADTAQELEKAGNKTEELSQKIEEITLVHQQKIDQLKKESTEHSDKAHSFKQELQTERERYSLELDALKGKVIDAEEKQKMLHQELGLREETLQLQSIQVGDLEKEVEALSDKNQELQKNLLLSAQTSERERTQRNFRLEEQAKEIIKLQDSVEKTSAESILLLDKQAQLKTQAEQLSQINCQQAKDLNSLKAQLDLLTAEKMDLSQQKDHWAAQASSLEDALNTERAGSECLKKEIGFWQLKHEELIKNVTELRKEAIDFTGEKTRLCAEISSAKKEEAQTKELLVGQERQLAHAQQTITQLEDAIRQQEELRRKEKALLLEEMEKNTSHSNEAMLEALRTKEVRHQQEVTQLNEQLEKVVLEYKKVSDRLEQTQSSLSNASSQILSLEKKVVELGDLQEKHDQLLKTLGQSERKIECLIADLEAQRQINDKNADEFKTEVESLCAQYEERFQAEAAQLHSSLTKQEQETFEKEKELVEKGILLEETKKQLALLHKEIESEQERHQNEVVSIKGSIKISEEEKTLAQEALEQLKSKIADAEQKYTLLSETLSLIRKELETQKSAAEELIERNRTLELTLQQSYTEIEEVRAQGGKELESQCLKLQQTQLEKEEAEAALAVLKIEQAELSEKLGQFTQQEKEMSAQLRELSQAKEILQQELSDTKSELALLVQQKMTIEEGLTKEQAKVQKITEKLQQINDNHTKERKSLEEKIKKEKKEHWQELKFERAKLSTTYQREVRTLQEQLAKSKEEIIRLEGERGKKEATLKALRNEVKAVSKNNTEKQKEIERLTHVLGNVAQQKALDVYKHAIADSKDAIFLRTINEASTAVELPDIGFEKQKIASLNEYLSEIKEVATNRLAKLGAEALADLRGYVNSGSSELLNRIKDAHSNEDLEKAGFKKEQIAFLDTEDYTQAVTLATERLEKNETAISSILDVIDSNRENKKFLELIQEVKKNDHLSIKIPEALVQDLTDECEYQHFADIATQYLIELESQEHDASPPKKLKANILFEKQNHFNFKDEKIDKRKEKEELPPLDIQGNIMPHDETSLSLNLRVYKAAHIDDNYVIRAHKAFTDPDNKVRGVALLVQDNTKKVVDRSYGDFSEEHKIQIAMKQAMMFLLSYRPEYHSKKEFFITGKSLESHNKLFAALLYFKQKDPYLKDLIIKSLHMDCTGPRYQWYIRNQVSEELFIKEHLGSNFLSDKEYDTLRSQLIETRMLLKNRYRFMTPNLKGDAEQTNSFSLNEGDEINNKGTLS